MRTHSSTRVTPIVRGRASTGGVGAGRRASCSSGGASASGASSARAQIAASGREGSGCFAPLASVSSRQSQRDLTAGWPPRRSAWIMTTSGAQAACAKSCAAPSNIP